MAKKKTKTKNHSRLLSKISVVILALALIAFGMAYEYLTSTPADYSDAVFTMHVIDVGQGDSIFIKVGDCDILIDAGTSSYGTTVSNYLKNQGVDDIELVY